MGRSVGRPVGSYWTICLVRSLTKRVLLGERADKLVGGSMVG